MKHVVLAIALTGIWLNVVAHDGGVSELTACTTQGTTTFTWQLHEVEDADKHWLIVSDSAGPLVPVSYQQTGHHHVELRWNVEAPSDNPDWVVSIPGVKHLPYGHRVLASNCDRSRRAVLSQWQTQWNLSASGVTTTPRVPNSEPALTP